MAIAMTSGEKIAVIRKKRGLTQSQLGLMVHETQRTVSNIETGEVTIDIERLKRYAIALQVDIGDLL